jgi:hypothetical protein
MANPHRGAVTTAHSARVISASTAALRALTAARSEAFLFRIARSWGFSYLHRGYY